MASIFKSTSILSFLCFMCKVNKLQQKCYPQGERLFIGGIFWGEVTAALAGQLLEETTFVEIWR